jgi:serine/threonine-protein kinase RsbW
VANPASGQLADNEVELRMLARTALPSTVRAITADIAMRADFDMDSVADLRLAVDEVCATVVRHARPDAVLTCRVAVRPDCLEIIASVQCPPQQSIRIGRLNWRILEALADSARLWITEDDGEPHVHLRIVKFRDLAEQNGV